MTEKREKWKRNEEEMKDTISLSKMYAHDALGPFLDENVRVGQEIPHL